MKLFHKKIKKIFKKGIDKSQKYAIMIVQTTEQVQTEQAKPMPKPRPKAICRKREARLRRALVYRYKIEGAGARPIWQNAKGEGKAKKKPKPDLPRSADALHTMFFGSKRLKTPLAEKSNLKITE